MDYQNIKTLKLQHFEIIQEFESYTKIANIANILGYYLRKLTGN